MDRRYEFVADAKRVRHKNEKETEIVGSWTDGLMLSSEYEKGWPCAFRLKAGKRYRVTVEELED